MQAHAGYAGAQQSALQRSALASALGTGCDPLKAGEPLLQQTLTSPAPALAASQLSRGATSGAQGADMALMAIGDPAAQTLLAQTPVGSLGSGAAALQAAGACAGTTPFTTLASSVLAEQTEASALPFLTSYEVPNVSGFAAQAAAPIAAAAGMLPTAQMTSRNPALAAGEQQLQQQQLQQQQLQQQQHQQPGPAPLTLEQARCVGAAASRMNVPVGVQPSDTLALGIPSGCGPGSGASSTSCGFCPPTNLGAAAVARAVYVRGTTQCMNNCAQTGTCCNSHGCIPGPRACAASAAGLSDPNIPTFTGWVQPFPVSPMYDTCA